MTEIEKGLEETPLELTAVDIFNPDSLDKSVSTRKSYASPLINHYGNPLTDTHDNDTFTAVPIIDKIKTKAEVESDFFEIFEASFVTL